jgi:hypothetical protein
MAEITTGTATVLAPAAPAPIAAAPASTGPVTAAPTVLQKIETAVFGFLQAHYPKIVTAVIGFFTAKLNVFGLIGKLL